MNEIKPNNLKMILWSDDDYYLQQCNLSHETFENLMNSIDLDNDLIVYGNVENEGCRKNTLFELKDNTLKGHIAAPKRLFSTWFIDENDDLWCRDEDTSDGVDFYLYRQFAGNNEIAKYNTKLNLALAYEDTEGKYDAQDYLDNTSSIGGLLKDKLLDLVLSNDLSNKLKDLKKDDDYAEHCVYMSEVLSKKLNIDKSYLLLDKYNEFVQDCTNNWKYWDDLKSLQVDTIKSMESFIDMNKTNIINEFNALDINDLGTSNDYVKGKEK